MAKKWTWAILSAIWLAAAILNYFDRRSWNACSVQPGSRRHLSPSDHLSMYL